MTARTLLTAPPLTERICTTLGNDLVAFFTLRFIVNHESRTVAELAGDLVPPRHHYVTEPQIRKCIQKLQIIQLIEASSLKRTTDVRRPSTVYCPTLLGRECLAAYSAYLVELLRS